MKPHALERPIRLALVLLPLGGCTHAPAAGAARQPEDSVARTRVVLAHPLPPLDGGHLALTVMEVRYGPGQSSTPHQHPCPVTGYVLEGAYRSQVQGEPETTYTTGQSFYEAPNAVHLVSANASRDRPVRFLASFTCDHAGPLSVDVPDSAAGGVRRP